jgi:hypothetical protein
VPTLAAAGAPPSQDRPAAGRRLLAAVAAAGVLALLFLAYLQVSRTYPENSDESNTLLMAWDMLHGNVLLHGWYLSDVSFWTTELPQYVMLERLIGLHTDTAHVGAAMTFTLVLVFAVLLARGTAPRRQAASRMLLTAGIMFAPQLGVGVFVLLLSVGHIGTAVPLMLTFLLIDRLKPRWWVPAAVGLLLTWVLVADPLVLVAGIVPLVAVCALRVARDRTRRYELWLAVAAIGAYGLASLVNRLLRASGAFFLHPVPYQLAPARSWPKHAWVTGKGLLALFGAKPYGPPAQLAFALVHLAGVVLVAWAMWRVARRFISWPDMISQVLLLAMVINVLVYIPSTLANATDLNGREFAVVLPFGAVLAGRTLGDRLLEGARWRRALAGALLAGYAASLGYAAAQPPAPAMNTQLARFLAAHHLTHGVGGYWLSSVVTVGSDGAVTVRAVYPGNLKPDLWEAKASWFDPATQRATFLVTSSKPGFFNHWEPSQAALAAYGPPARTYHVGPYTVYVWNRNLFLCRTGRGARLRPCSTRRGAVVSGCRDVALACGSANIRAGERVRRHLHVPGTAAAVARRGGTLPLPAGGVMGQEQQRLPQERGAPVPGCGQPSRIRHAGVRQRPGPGRARQGGRADPGGTARRRRQAAARGGHRRRHLPVQEQHGLGGQLLRLP